MAFVKQNSQMNGKRPRFRRIDAEMGQWLLSIFFLAWVTFVVLVALSHYQMFGDIKFRPDMPMGRGGSLESMSSVSTQVRRNQLLYSETADYGTPPRVTIFYHVYMQMDDDPNKKGSERSEQRALKIIRQQLRHVAKSLAEIPNMEHVHLYYTTVGDKQGHEKVEEICKHHAAYFTCHHLQHVEAGFEETSLGAMYEFCQDHEDERVVYLHTKGSYHYSQSQDYWRQHLTKAAMSSDCIQRAHAEGCELCGLLFLPRPALHFTGNMFNAKCEYLCRLSHPKTFEAKLVSVHKKGQELIERGILQPNLLNMLEPCNTGSGRFAMEHWHGSHPSLQKVCDVSTHYQIEYWQGIDPKDAKPEAWHFDVFPRHPITADWSHANTGVLIANILNNEGARLREYFLLPGLLVKWYELYGQAPPASSWIWTWYPDGQFWKRQVAKFGSKAVETVIAEMTEQEEPEEEEEEEEAEEDDEEQAEEEEDAQ